MNLEDTFTNQLVETGLFDDEAKAIIAAAKISELLHPTMARRWLDDGSMMLPGTPPRF